MLTDRVGDHLVRRRIRSFVESGTLPETEVGDAWQWAWRHWDLHCPEPVEPMPWVTVTPVTAFGREERCSQRHRALLVSSCIGVNGFGASAPGPVVMREFGFTPEHVVETARAVLKRTKEDSHGEKSG